MAYIGRYVGTDKTTKTLKLDTIQSQFNGSQTVFSLRSDNVAVYPPVPQSLVISLNGVIQEPTTAYTVSADTITFSPAPATNTAFFGVLNGGQVDIGTFYAVGDATIAGRATFSNTVSITGAANALSTLGVTGTLSALGQLSVTGNATFDTSTLFVDAVNNRVGIGVTTPQKSLVVSDAGNIGFEVSPNDAAQGYTRLLNYNRSTSQYTPVRYEGSTHTWYANTSGTDRIMDITANGDVAIGSTTARTRFTVVGRSFLGGGGSPISLGSAGNNYSAVFTNSDSAYGVAIAVASSGNGYLQAQRFDGTATAYDLVLQPAGGKVGIGGSPNYTLEVQNGTADAGIVAKTSNNSQDSYVSSYNSHASSGNYIQMRSYGNASSSSTTLGQSAAKLNAIWSSGDAVFAIGTQGSTAVVLGTNNAERLRITNGGLVGINTTSPLYQFQVSGAANAGDGPFILGNSANTSYFDQATGAYLHTPGAMVRKDSSTTDMAQAPATFVLYNKNGTDSTGPKLVFAGNETTSTSANPVALAAIAAQKVSGTAGSWATGNMKFLVKATSAYTDVMTLASTGYVTCVGIYNATVGATNRDVYVDNTGLVGYVSSIRASKMNIADITDTAWLLNLNPVSFNYRKKDTEGQYTEEPDGPIEYGLIAEDTEAVKPELCFYDIVDGVPELRGVSYSKLITPLLKLVQQQHELIQTQQAAIGALETRVAALEA